MKNVNIIRPKETWRTQIIKPDQYLDHYIYEKATNPDAQLVVKSFQREVVDAVDRIVELAHGERDVVKSDNDWRIVEEIIKFYSQRWPNEWYTFRSSIGDIKQIKGEGMSRTREIKHVGSIPPRLMKLMKVIFPQQQWNKDFTSKFVKRFPLFKVGEKQK